MDHGVHVLHFAKHIGGWLAVVGAVIGGIVLGKLGDLYVCNQWADVDHEVCVGHTLQTSGIGEIVAGSLAGLALGGAIGAGVAWMLVEVFGWRKESLGMGE